MPYCVHRIKVNIARHLLLYGGNKVPHLEPEMKRENEVEVQMFLATMQSLYLKICGKGHHVVVNYLMTFICFKILMNYSKYLYLVFFLSPWIQYQDTGTDCWLLERPVSPSPDGVHMKWFPMLQPFCAPTAAALHERTCFRNTNHWANE